MNLLFLTACITGGKAVPQPDETAPAESDADTDTDTDSDTDCDCDTDSDADTDSDTDTDTDTDWDTDTDTDTCVQTTEVCNGVDDDCDGDVDEDVITDGQGCLDEGMPTIGTDLDVLHVMTVTNTGDFDGTDDPMLVCLDAGTTCYTLDNESYNDNERGQTGLYSWEGIPLDRSQADRIRLVAGGSDGWQPDCVAVHFDGELVFCTDVFTDPLQTDGVVSYEELLPTTPSCERCMTSAITAGPMVGAVGPETATIWLRGDRTRKFELFVTPVGVPYGLDPTAFLYPLATEDFTVEAHLDGLQPGSDYEYRIDADDGSTASGSFTTPPLTGSATQFRFAFGSCAKDPDQPIWATVAAQDPDLFLSIGDNHYANSDDLSTLRFFYWWSLDQGLRSDVTRNTAHRAVWDDHDFTGNNTDGYEPGKDVALRVFHEYWAHPTDGTPGIYTTASWGDVDFFFIDDRYYRGLDGTMLGAVQRAWLEAELLASTATFKFLVGGSQWSPESSNSSDGWPSFPEEALDLFDWLAAEDIPGLVFLSGDVHRSEIRTVTSGVGGYLIPELTSSPLANPGSTCQAHSNEMVDCFEDDDYVLTLDVDTTLPDPTITVRVVGSAGTEFGSWVFAASELQTPPWVPSSEPDFDGDGHADLLVGQTGEAVGSVDGAGAVTELRGAPGGLRALQGRHISENTAGGTSETDDAFGTAVATGDFDGDGFTDAAVGIPGKSVAGADDAGRIAVLYGTATGLDPAAAVFFDAETAGVPSLANAGDAFGAALATGDFDGDTRDDLAIGMPGNSGDEGGVVVLYGSSTGLGTTGAIAIDQADGDMAGTPEAGDRFGAALAAGDFDGDTFDDLAIGVPGEALGTTDNAGMIALVFGSASGLSTTGTDSYHQDQAGSGDMGEQDDAFGHALATGDLNGDTFVDLVIGVPGEDGDVGAVTVMLGGSGGLVPAAHVVPGGQRAGEALAIGDFDQDGFDDIAIGAPDGSGSVHVVPGSGSGPDTSSIVAYDQSDLSGTTPESGDAFGAALLAADFDADGFVDLAIGVPGEDTSDGSNVGIVQLLRGGPTLLRTAPYQIWSQATPYAPGGPEAGDRFGSALP